MERRNEELREQLGFYVPLHPLDQPENPPAKIRNLFNGHTVGHSRYQEILKMIEGTKLMP